MSILYLEAVNISKSVLDMGINNQFSKPQDFTAKMESITKPRLLTFLGSQSLDGLQVKVVIKMKVIKVLTMNQEIQHVVTLTAHLETCFYPVQCCGLEKLGGFEGTEQVPINNENNFIIQIVLL